MKSENNNSENYVLQLGENENFRYEVTPEVKKILEETIFRSYCLAQDRKELDAIEICLSKNLNIENAEKRIAELSHIIKDEEESLKDVMNDMEKNNVPNWVGNGALYFGETTNLKSHYTSEFFETSQYAHGKVKDLQKEEKVEEEPRKSFSFDNIDIQRSDIPFDESLEQLETISNKEVTAELTTKEIVNNLVDKLFGETTQFKSQQLETTNNKEIVNNLVDKLFGETTQLKSQQLETTNNKEITAELTAKEIVDNLVDELNRARDIMVDEELSDSNFIERIDNALDKIIEERENADIQLDTLNELTDLLNTSRDIVQDNEIDFDLVADIDADLDRAYEVLNRRITERLADSYFGDVSFEIEDGVLLKYNGEDKNVVIPDSVTEIGASAFEYCTSLTEITIPDSVTKIGKKAFRWCDSLEEITLPDSVTSIGDYAFEECNSLKSINIPNSVISIGNCAFYNCDSLETITIPDSVTSIGDYVFAYCNLTSINIPDSVTEIGKSAFYNCDNLEEINIPDGVTSIGERAFASCASLTSINIPVGVTSIKESTFEDCRNLKEINIPDGVTLIEDSAFGHCTNLTSINIPDSVTLIEGYAFEKCYSLKEITLPDDVEIKDRAFKGCINLEFEEKTDGSPDFDDI